MNRRYYALRTIEPEVGKYYIDQFNRLFYVSRLIDGVYYCHLFNGTIYIETHLEYEHVSAISNECAGDLIYGEEDAVLVAEVNPVHLIEHQHDFLDRATELI